MASNDANPDGGEREVFGSLPRSRPQRRSAKRDRGPAASKAEPAPTAGARPKAAPRPQQRDAARKPPAKVPPAGYATPSDDGAPTGAALVTTAVQAAGELAQIGIAAGGRALKSAIHRLPRP
jgi:hypothetical protein